MKLPNSLIPYKRQIIILTSVVLTLLIVLIATPYIIQNKITKTLLEMGAQEASVADVNLNPFSGVAEITHLQFSTATASDQRLDKLSVNVHLLSLFKKWVHLKNLTVDGLNLSIEIDESGKPIIGGLTIPESTDAENKTAEKSKPWGFGIDAVDLSQINVDYRDPKLASNLNIAELNIGDLANWNGEQESPLSLKAKLNGNAIDFTGKALPFSKDPTFSGKAILKQIELKPFAPFVPQLTTLSGQLSLDATIELVQQADKTIKATHSGEFKLENLNAQNPDFALEQNQLTWSGTLGATITEEQFRSSMDAKLVLTDIQAATGDTQLASLHTLSSTIQFDSLDNIQLSQNNIEKLIIGNKLYKAKSEKEAAKNLLSIKKIAIPNIALAEMRQVEIDEINIETISSMVQRNSEGIWLPVTLINALPQQESAIETEEKSSADETPAAVFKIGKLNIDGENHILFDDLGVTPPYRADLAINKLEIGAIDSTNPEQASPLQLLAAVDKHSTITASGTITPLAQEPTLELTNSIKAVPLSPLSSYVIPLMGYTLKSGQLDAENNVKMGLGKVNGEIKLTLNALEVESFVRKQPKQEAPKDDETKAVPESAEAPKEASDLDSKMSIPLGIALNMLRDKNRTIKLTIPISGNTNNPDIDPSDVINTVLATALKKGAMSYLISSMQPYGALISLAKMAGDGAMKVRLEPVKFESTSIAINETTRDYLPKVVKLMADRPEINIKVCGVATESDYQTLLAAATAAAKAKHAVALAKYETLVKKSPKGKPQPTPAPQLVIPTIEDEQLLKLAKGRVISVKDLLITQLKADATHLIDCQPSINRETIENPPRVELLI